METLTYTLVGLFMLFTLFVIILIAYRSYTGKFGNFISIDDTSFYLGFVAGLGVCLLFVLIVKESTPSAMDVYEGKTVLKVTYKDDVPVDSIVKFKEVDNKYYEFKR